MEIIFQGAKFEVEITSFEELTGGRLYSRATRTAYDVKVANDSGAKYLLTIKANDYTEDGNTYKGTASMAEGVYDLELYGVDDDGLPVIHYHKARYAQVKASSFTQVE